MLEMKGGGNLVSDVDQVDLRARVRHQGCVVITEKAPSEEYIYLHPKLVFSD